MATDYVALIREQVKAYGPAGKSEQQDLILGRIIEGVAGRAVSDLQFELRSLGDTERDAKQVATEIERDRNSTTGTKRKIKKEVNKVLNILGECRKEMAKLKSQEHVQKAMREGDSFLTPEGLPET